ncbi:leucyl aminopeptidase [Marininema halotolerans]|uniref:Probable cytosol aminopeptidase n=1 Tax=Marininema halotolerans TaxID=1155944 RepID=A0A1I6UTJ0_9BACL|nr:leucyl aminopeptidase [Marininema halotolerans]SFT04751.1 leucyl aminopeptidase [Marininema halotolerans]
MDWKITKEPVISLAVDCLMVLHTNGGESIRGCAGDVDLALEHRLSQLISEGEITGHYQETVLIHNWGKIPAKRLLVLGLGKDEALTLDKIRDGMAVAVRRARQAGVKQLALGCSKAFSRRWNAADFIQAIVEGVELGLYCYDGYKHEEESKNEIKSICLAMEGISDSALEAGLARGRAFAIGVNRARDLANEPANKLTPQILAERAITIAEKQGLAVEVLDEERLQELNMDALLSVARASVNPARMIVLKYQGAPETKETLGLIGKGVTFDSGGIQVKPDTGMEKQKGDMAGAAAVLGAMEAIGELKPHCNVLAVIPTCENMISGNNYRPGDVIGSFSGKTIEIHHTDAEGRLILADGLAYARRLGATSLVDVATLTGGVIIALGYTVTGLMTNNSDWATQVKEASRIAGEKVWELPLEDEVEEYLKSDLADIKNDGGRPAQTCQGGVFLRHFVEDVPWVHLDIAGTAQWRSGEGIHRKGATGVAVRTMAQLAMRFSQE